MLFTDLHTSPPPSRSVSRGLIRTASSSSLGCGPISPLPQTFPEVSAKHHLRPTRFSIDYSLPSSTESASARLLSCSVDNTLLFTRGNRVYSKNLNNTLNEDFIQLCKLPDSRGSLRAIECGGKSHPGVVAIGTSQGFIQTWDIRTRKMLMSWPTTKDISALAWNGSVLTVGGAKGTIRLYDTRISPAEKMREQARKITRHQGRISCLSWNDDGKLLASGDSSGMVHCWESGQIVPMNVGEFVQRRKKIQHDGSISALAWSSWSSKLLATGDDKGCLRLWNVNPNDPSSNLATPGKVDTSARITGIHFSTQCMEILTTHGNAVPIVDSAANNSPSHKSPFANSLAVHTASLRHVTTLNVPTDKPIGDSVLSANGMKVVFTVPDEAKINICDAWAKRKELRRQASFTSDTSLYIR
ncbi:WD40-repeat-containing domain protein [Crepidotus variabilis]|uniref:WD40-repeat-containing domain protein n=1 Tax=Crepidotus variabilis TaxID=179855 RepID=A0A9P6EI83_9AGAR|nr:WD40-repeat-containing domain protein [Crepidotus variabilis]